MEIRAYWDTRLKYSNRTIYNISDTSEFPVWDYLSVKSFNPNDCINSSMVVNCVTPPTYLVIEGGSFSATQWYVIGYTFIRKEQWRISIMRDLLGETDNWKYEIASVEKGKDMGIDNLLGHRKYDLDLDVVKLGQYNISNQYGIDANAEPLYSAIFYYSKIENVSQLSLHIPFVSFNTGDIAQVGTDGSDPGFLNMEFVMTIGTPSIAGTFAFAIRGLREIDRLCIMTAGSWLRANDTNCLDFEFIPCYIPTVDRNGNNVSFVAGPVQNNLIQMPHMPDYPCVYFYADSFEVDIDTPSNMQNLSGLPVELKKDNIKVRLNSPSWSSAYEYTPYDTGYDNPVLSFIGKFSVKPYGISSVILPKHNNTGSLYGQDYRDVRGIYTNDNTSVTKVDDAWVNFKRTNQMYEQTFNREIQSMELANSWQDRMDPLRQVANYTESQAYAKEYYNKSVGGGILGSIMNIATSGGWDPAGVGKDVSEAGKLDIQMGKEMRDDALDKAKTMQALQIASIKAQPVSISKVDGILGFNSMTFLLEIFGAPYELADFIIDYYKHNGHIINTIGIFADYIEPGCFFAGSLLKSEAYSETEMKEINARLKGGIYNGV